MNNTEQKSPNSTGLAPIFSSPLEDTSGLDVFAQIAASVNPIPVTSVEAEKPSIQRRHSSASIVQQNQSQLAQSIYQAQQALREQQRRTSTTTNASSSFSDFEDDDDFDDDFDMEEDEMAENEREKEKMIKRIVKPQSNSIKFIPYQPQTIKEESETDLLADSPSMSATYSTESVPMIRRSSLPANTFSSSSQTDLPPHTSNRRIIHNICERKRRENIREGFESLQARLPGDEAENARLSKMEILQGALEVITGLRSRISVLNEECEALKLVSETKNQ